MKKTLSTKTFNAGEIIFSEGDLGECAFLIDKGRVEIKIDDKGVLTPIAVLGVGEIFGEMAIIDHSARSATAVALDTTELLIISKEQLQERVKESDPIVRFLVAVLIERVRSSLGRKKESTNTLPHIKKRDQFVEKESDDVIQKIKLEKDLKAALEKNELTMFYQPVVDTETNKIGGFEALIRWNSLERGMVRPDIFMGIAEETSLVVPIGQWVLKKACEEFRVLKDSLIDSDILDENPFISVNVASKQLNDPYFFKVIDDSLKKHRIPPHQLKLEITERILVEGANASQWIKKCRKRGLSVALDDFGTGYSSLSYLADLEVNNIKIDKSFISKITKDFKTASIVKSLIELSKALNLTVIAEGIETETELRILKRFGCSLIQGYYFYRPECIKNLLEIFQKNAKKSA